MASSKTITASDPNPYGVKVGDIWEDCDKRMGKRSLSVRSINLGTGKARCVVWATGREVEIALSRFKPTSTGYRRIQEG